MRPPNPSDQRLTVAPSIIATLGVAMLLSGRVVDGTAHDVVRLVLLVLLVAVTAWCASVFRSARGDQPTQDGRPADNEQSNSQGGQ